MSTNSSHVDERVVQMTFDNMQFEKNIAQTMKSLDELKKSLEFEKSARSFEALERAVEGVNLRTIADNVQFLADRFSNMGIVGMTVVKRLTESVMNFSGKLITHFFNPISQIKEGGWNRAANIENAMFKMSGLLKEEFEEQRETIDKNINYAVSGTAYSYDAAANAMAQLMASGVEFRGVSEDMKKALRGISGVAAMTNSDYSEIAHIFTTVAGNGKLMTEQLNQIAGRGINAAATLAEAFHVSEAELRDMVSHGKISFQEFANAMDDAFGEHAKAANNTFDGALSNIKAALSRTGQGFSTALRNMFKDIFNAIRPNINNFNKYLEPLVKDFEVVTTRIALGFQKVFGDGSKGILNIKWVQYAIDTIRNVALGLLGIFDAIRKGFDNLFPESNRNALLNFWLNMRRLSILFRDAFAKVTEFVKPVTDAVSGASAKMNTALHTAEELQEITKRVIRGDFGNGQKRFDALTELGWNWKIVQNNVNEALGCAKRYELTAEELAELEGNLTEEEKKQIENQRRNLRILNNISDTVKGFSSVLGLVKEFATALWDEVVLPFLKGPVLDLLDKVLSFTAAIGRYLGNILEQVRANDTFRNVLKQIVALFKLAVLPLTHIGSIVDSIFKKIAETHLLQKFITWLTNKLLALPKQVNELANKFHEMVASIKELSGVKRFLSGLSVVRATVSNLIRSGIEKVSGWFSNIGNIKFPTVDWSKAANIFSNLLGHVADFFTWFSNLKIIKSATNVIKKFFSDIPGSIKTAKQTILDFWDALKTRPEFQKLVEKVTEFKDRLEELGKGALEKVKEKLTGIQEIDLPNLQDFVDIFADLSKKVTDLIEKVGTLYDKFKALVDPYITNGLERIGGLMDYIKGVLSGDIEFNIDTLSGAIGGLFGKDKLDVDEDKAGTGILETIKGIFAGIKFEDIAKAIKLATGSYLAMKIALFFGQISSGAKELKDSVKGIPDSITGTLDQVRITLAAYQNQLNAKSLMYIAGAILMLVGAIGGLLYMQVMYPDQLKQVVTDLLAIMLVLALIIRAYSMIKKTAKTMEQAGKVAETAKDTAEKVAEAGKTLTIKAGLEVLGEGIKTFGQSIALALKGFSFAAGILAFMGSIFLLLKAIDKITDMLSPQNRDATLQGFFGLIAIISVIGILGTIMSKEAYNFNAGMGVGFLGIAAALLLMVDAIEAMSEAFTTNTDGFIVGVISLIGMLAIFGKLAKDSNYNEMVKFGAGLMLVAVAMTMLVVPIGILSTMAKMGLPIMEVAIALGVLMAAFAIVSKFGDQSIKAAAGVALLSGSLLIVATAVGKLSKIGGMDIAKKMLGLTAGISLFVIAMTGIAAVLSYAGLSKKLEDFSATLLILSTSLLIFSAALLVLGVALPYLTDGLAYLGQGLMDNAAAIGLGFGAVVAAIALAVVAAQGSLAEAGKSLITVFMNVLQAKFDPFLSMISGMGLKIIIAVVTLIVLAAEPILMALIALINTIADNIHKHRYEILSAVAKIIGAVLELIVDAVVLIVQSILEAAGPIVDAIGKVFGFTAEDLSKKLDEFLDEFDGSAEVYMDDCSAIAQKGKETATEVSDAATTIEEEKTRMTDAVDGAKNYTVTSMLDAGNGMNGALGSTINLPGALGGQNGLGGMKTMLAGALPELGGLSGDLGGGLTDTFGQYFNPSGTVDEELMHRVPETIRQAAATDKYAYMDYLDYMTDDAAANARINAQENANEIGSSFMDGLEEYDYSTANIDLSGMYTASYDDAYAAGSEAPQGYAQGAIDNVTAIQDAGSEMANTLVSATDSAKTELQQSGSQGALGFARGMSTMVSRVKSEGQRLKSNAVSGTNGVYDKMYTQGSNAGEGFYDGMRSWIQRIADKAYEMGDKAVDSAKRGIDSNSPSKKTRKLGVYFDQGFILGMLDLSGHVEDAASNVATAALDSMRTAVGKIGAILSSDLDYEPTIRPVMDLSDVETGAQLINDAIANSGAFIPLRAVGSTARIAGQFSASGSRLPGEDVANSGNTYTFTQNNYSPRALSRLEIYRQTKNQFAQMKGLTANG